MVSAPGEGNHLTHVGTVAGDYRQRQKTSGFRWMAQKQRVKNLLKTGSVRTSGK